ncbi:MAG: hypothetical protein U1E05_02625 [Patescibacteria group bacterium]|nr:hypothetical protein [Patescibacteria group bacterium]
MLRTFAALILVANYLAVMTVGNWHHTHDPAGHACCAAGVKAHGRCHSRGCNHAGCCNRGTGSKPISHDDGPRPLGKPCDDCPICRFQAEKTLPILLEASEDSAPLGEEVPSLWVVPPATAPLCLPLNRGPPWLA